MTNYFFTLAKKTAYTCPERHQASNRALGGIRLFKHNVKGKLVDYKWTPIHFLHPSSKESSQALLILLSCHFSMSLCSDWHNLFLLPFKRTKHEKDQGDIAKHRLAALK